MSLFNEPVLAKFADQEWPVEGYGVEADWKRGFISGMKFCTGLIGMTNTGFNAETITLAQENERRLIDDGAAQYNPQTGDWEWLPREEDGE